jgi:hypothetical protein
MPLLAEGVSPDSYKNMPLLTEGEDVSPDIYKHAPPDGGQNSKTAEPLEDSHARRLKLLLLITPHPNAKCSFA